MRTSAGVIVIWCPAAMQVPTAGQPGRFPAGRAAEVIKVTRLKGHPADTGRSGFRWACPSDPISATTGHYLWPDEILGPPVTVLAGSARTGSARRGLDARIGMPAADGVHGRGCHRQRAGAGRLVSSRGGRRPQARRATIGTAAARRSSQRAGRPLAPGPAPARGHGRRHRVHGFWPGRDVGDTRGHRGRVAGCGRRLLSGADNDQLAGGGSASSSPVVQADDLINFLKTGAAGVPTVMLDIEYNPNPDGTGQCYGLSQSAMVSWIAAFGAEVQKSTGQQPVIYTPPGWWKDCTGGSAAFGQIPLWTPYYSATASSPVATAGWGNWAFWQYTSTGTVTGINDAGHTDLDQLNPAVLPLLDPGAQHYLVGSPVGRRIKPADPVVGQTLSFSATGLPRGVAISSTAQITGWPVAPGSYASTVTASDGHGLTGSVSFTWTVSMPPDAGPAGPVPLDLGGKCLDDVHNLAAAGTPAEIWTCNGAAAQSWKYVQDGTLRMHGMCLTVPAGAADGWKVRLGPCTDGARQQWRPVYPRAVDPSLGGRPTALLNRGSGKCLDDPGWSTTNGTRVVIWSCNGDRNQAWTLPPGPVASQIPGRCLDDSGNLTADGTKVDIWSCNGSAEQTWTVKSDGTVRVNGKCLDVAGSATASGTLVDLYSCNGGPGQQWRLAPEGAVGARLANPLSGLCLTDPADATASGVQLQILACSTTDPGQAWRVS